MKPTMTASWTVRMLGILLIAAPVSIVATVFLLPLWSWIERSTGVESVGHSGPAGWCYAVVLLIVSVVMATAIVRYASR